MNNEIDNYFMEVEGHFAHRRGRATFVSPLDWTLIQHWKESGVPLSVALAGIDDAFNSRKDSTTQINSLRYCQNAVERKFKTWNDNRIGAHDDANDGGAVEPTDDAGNVTAALTKMFAAVEKWCELQLEDMNVPCAIHELAIKLDDRLGDTIENYRSSQDFEALNWDLERLAGFADAALQEATPDAAFYYHRSLAVEDLTQFGFQRLLQVGFADERDRVINGFLIKRLRLAYNLPSLSLTDYE